MRGVEANHALSISQTAQVKKPRDTARDRAMPPKVAREHLANMVGSNNTKAWLPAPVHLCLSSLCFVTATLGDGEGAIKLGSQYRLPVPGIRHAVETKS